MNRQPLTPDMLIPQVRISVSYVCAFAVAAASTAHRLVVAVALWKKIGHSLISFKMQRQFATGVIFLWLCTLAHNTSSVAMRFAVAWACWV